MKYIDFRVKYISTPTNLRQLYVLSDGIDVQEIWFVIKPYGSTHIEDIRKNPVGQLKHLNMYIETIPNAEKISIFSTLKSIDAEMKGLSRSLTGDGLRDKIYSMLSTLNYHRFYDFVKDKIPLPSLIKSDSDMAKIVSRSERKTSYSEKEYKELVAMGYFARFLLGVYLAGYFIDKSINDTLEKPYKIYSMARQFLDELDANRRLHEFIEERMQQGHTKTNKIRELGLKRQQTFDEIVTHVQAETFQIIMKFLQDDEPEKTLISYIFTKVTDRQQAGSQFTDTKGIGVDPDDDYKESNSAVAGQFANIIEASWYASNPRFILRDKPGLKDDEHSLGIVNDLMVKLRSYPGDYEVAKFMYPLISSMFTDIQVSHLTMDYYEKLPGEVQQNSPILVLHACAILLCMEMGWGSLGTLLSSVILPKNWSSFEFEAHSTSSIVNISIPKELMEEAKSRYIKDSLGNPVGYDGIKDILTVVDGNTFRHFYENRKVPKEEFANLRNDLHEFIVSFPKAETKRYYI